MGFKSDIEIAQECTMEPITKIAEKAGIDDKYLEQYGKYKAKIDYNLLKETDKKDGKLILVTAINPTPAGEGKTTTTVGLADGMQKLGKNVMVALREPSLGPVFGVKGGAAGGGYAQVVPMEDINLHFTGDFHAITSANNLLAAMLDNSIQQGNVLNIDPNQVVWKRCVDMNDRVLRNVVVGLGRKVDGTVREDHFVITVASEIMAILCLATSYADLKERLGKIIVAYTYDGQPVTAKDVKAVGAMAALLKDAMKPNIIQTLEHTPALVHGGPFANIAHGCNSVKATKTALKMADYVITEAGFGEDLGAHNIIKKKIYAVRRGRRGVPAGRHRAGAGVAEGTVERGAAAYGDECAHADGAVPRAAARRRILEGVRFALLGVGWCRTDDHVPVVHRIGADLPGLVHARQLLSDRGTGVLVDRLDGLGDARRFRGGRVHRRSGG